MARTLGDFAKLLGIPVEDIPIVDLLKSFGEKIEAKDKKIEQLQIELKFNKKLHDDDMRKAHDYFRNTNHA